MENDANRIPVSPTDATDAVPEIDPIRAARTPHGPMVDRENDAVALSKRYYNRPRLHTRALFGEHEFSTREISVGLRQQDSYLYGENVFTIEILMDSCKITR